MAGRFTVETVFKGIDNTSGVISGIEKRTKAMERGLHGPVGFADKGIEGFKKIGAVAAVAGAAAGVAFGHLIETGADFEQSITNVGAVMGKSRGQIAELEKAALSLGVSTQFSSSEVSEAMEQMARKGFDSEEILAGIPGVLNAIAASGEGMAEVATVVGSSIRGFGLEARDASHVADVLAFSAEKTGAHITDMGSALATVAPTARALGVSIEDAAASVGLLQKMGIDASTAGSATATMLAKISHPSKEAAQKMTAMGIAFKDAKGNMLPFRDVLGQFVKAGDKAGGNMDRMSFFAELVGLRGDKAALALSDMAKSGDFDKLVAGLKNVDGYSEKVAKIRMDTTKGSWKLLTSTVEVLETKLFDLNDGGLKSTIDNVNKWITANQDLIIQDAGKYVKEISDGVHGLSTKIDKGLITLEFFGKGLEKAFKHSASIAVFGTVLEKVFGGNDSEGPGKKAHDLGYEIGYAVDKFILFAGVVYGAQAAVFVFGNALKVARGIQIGYQAIVGGTAAVQAMVGVTAVPASAGIASIGAAAAAAVPFVIALEAMLVALVAAAYELYKLYKESGGAGGMWAGIKGFHGVGTKSWGLNGYNEGVDNKMNEEAKQRRADEGVSQFSRAEEDAMRDPSSYRGGPGGGDILGSDRTGAAFLDALLANNRPPGPYRDGYASPTAARPPGPYADGYVPPGVAPQVAPQVVATNGGQSEKQTQTFAQLQASIAQLMGKIGATNGTLTIKLPPGVTGEVSGAPGVAVGQSGGFN